MNTEGIKPNIPIGDSKDLQNSRETLNAIPVKNVVRWVNENFETPFNFEVGEPTPVGVFLTPREGDTPSFSMEVFPEHGRTSLFGRVVFKDKEGNLYRDIDLKGLGYIKTTHDGKLEVTAPGGFLSYITHMGLMRMKTAKKDAQMAELLVKAGVRTDRILAIIELEEIVDGDGLRISAQEAKKQFIIQEDFIPVISVRAFGTRHRVSDLLYGSNPKDIIKDTLALVAQESGINPKFFTLKDYMIWFAKTLAKNMAIMHINGLCHDSMHEQNVTLDCRITDRDTMGVRSEMIKKYGYRETQKKFDIDLSSAEINVLSVFDSLQQLSLLVEPNSGLSDDELNKGLSSSFRKTLRLIFNEEYNKHMGPALNIPSGVRRIFEKIRGIIYGN